MVDVEYLSEYTHFGYDFSVLGSTPIIFPIVRHNSKISCYGIRRSRSGVNGATEKACLKLVIGVSPETSTGLVPTVTGEAFSSQSSTCLTTPLFTIFVPRAVVHTLRAPRAETRFSLLARLFPRCQETSRKAEVDFSRFADRIGCI